MNLITADITAVIYAEAASIEIEEHWRLVFRFNDY